MCNKLIHIFLNTNNNTLPNIKIMATLCASELRVDPCDGNPYTHESFVETYSDGEERWKVASIWKSDGTLRIRTAPVVDDSVPAAAAEENPPKTVSIPVPEFNENDFPSIGNSNSSSESRNALHYSRVLSPPEREVKSLSPEAEAFEPGASKHVLNYSKEECSSNEEFETLPASLWEGIELFPQPITNEESICVDWKKMIATWTPEQWHEFGIKYFYGYVQQSTILMGQIPNIDA